MSNELHTMPLKIEPLLSSRRVRMLELDEFGAYIKLLCDAWLNACALPKQCLSNAQTLARLLQCSEPVAERVIEKVVKVFFVENENGDFVNPNQLGIYGQVSAKCSAAIAKGKNGAAKRWMHKQCISNAQAMPEECVSNGIQIQNQSQISKEKYTSCKEKISAPPDFELSGDSGELAAKAEPKAARFRKPALEEVQAYCKERGNGVDPETFWNFYESKGWKVGQSPMRNWKSCCHTWERRPGCGPKAEREHGI